VWISPCALASFCVLPELSFVTFGVFLYPWSTSTHSLTHSLTHSFTTRFIIPFLLSRGDGLARVGIGLGIRVIGGQAGALHHAV
jgi:hypothetical protein